MFVKARGADFETGKVDRTLLHNYHFPIRCQVSAVRTSLVIAMESRCYHGGEGRTRMKKLSMKASDVLTILGSLIFLAGIIVLAQFGF